MERIGNCKLQPRARGANEHKSDAEGRVCGHGEKVPCYCATACPETFGDSQGLIAGPCDADEPLKLAPGSGDADSRAP